MIYIPSFNLFSKNGNSKAISFIASLWSENKFEKVVPEEREREREREREWVSEWLREGESKWERE